MGVGACGPPPTEPECRPAARLAYGKVSRHHLIPVIEPACIPVIEPACGAAGEAALPAVVGRGGLDRGEAPRLGGTAGVSLTRAPPTRGCTQAPKRWLSGRG